MHLGLYLLLRRAASLLPPRLAPGVLPEAAWWLRTHTAHMRSGCAGAKDHSLYNRNSSFPYNQEPLLSIVAFQALSVDVAGAQGCGGVSLQAIGLLSQTGSNSPEGFKVSRPATQGLHVHKAFMYTRSHGNTVEHCATKCKSYSVTYLCAS